MEAERGVYSAWETCNNVLLTMPTGGGKTVVFSKILKDSPVPCTALVHRKELVGQISQTLARYGVEHTVYGAEPLLRWVTQNHIKEFKRDYLKTSARVSVVSAQTLLSRADKMQAWASRQQLAVVDEGHHLLRGNLWGKCVDALEPKKLLGVSATPDRADGKGLGAHADGYYEQMVQGKSGRYLIDHGRLCEYQIYCPTSNVDISNVGTSKATGDLIMPQLIAEVRKSQIVGDIVEQYKRYALGMRTVVFVTDLETAAKTTVEFLDKGVRAAFLSSKQTDVERSCITAKFETGYLDVIVNVDLLGEGYDVPAIECVIFARHTQSYALFAQQFGRALRVMQGKTIATIIDLVGNVVRHSGYYGLPDMRTVWTLNAREKSGRKIKEKDPDIIPVRSCDYCTRPYPRNLLACPYCGGVPLALVSRDLEQVDGDLALLDPAALAELRAQIEKVDRPPSEVFATFKISQGGSKAAAYGAFNNQEKRQAAQKELRDKIARWAGFWKAQGESDREIHKRFYLGYGTSIYSAQGLGKTQANELEERIKI